MLNEYAYEYSGPKCFAKRIREEEIPKGISLKLPGTQKPYDGTGRPYVWIMDFFNDVVSSMEAQTSLVSYSKTIWLALRAFG